MARTRVGVIIGRFQVPELTPAHKALVRAVQKEQDTIAVLLGISPTDGRSAENPLTYVQRTHLFPPGLGYMVFPLADQATDEVWSASVDTLLRSALPPDRYEVTLYGGRKSFRESYSGAYPCQDIELHSDASGTETRAALKENLDPAFLAGQVYALQTQWPKVYPTVDVIVWRDPGIDKDLEVLLIQRTDNQEWGFVGGFVDPSDKSYANAATREVYEEVGLTAESGLKHVGSMRVNDWRYRGHRDQIMTTLYLMQYSFGPVKVQPEEVQDYQWVNYHEVEKVVSKTHAPLWNAAQNILWFSAREEKA